MPLTRRAIILGSTGAGVLVAGIGFWKSKLPRRLRRDASIAPVVEDGQRAFARATITSVDQATTIRSSTQGVAVQSDVDIHRSALPALRRQWGEFLEARLCLDAESYIKWRSSNGYSWHEQAYMESKWKLRENYERYFGPIGDGPFSLEQAFRDFWSKPRPKDLQSPAIVGIATAETGMSAVVGVSRNGHNDLFLSGPFLPEIWYGSIAQTLRCWWRGRIAERDVFASPEAIVAQTAAVCEFSDRTRVPLILDWCFDNEQKRWWLTGGGIQNLPHENYGNIDI